MPRKTLNEKFVKSIQAGKDRVDYFDTLLPGFGLRIWPGKPGEPPNKRWIVLYRLKGEKKLLRATIGSTAKFPKPEDARAAAREILQAAALGVNLVEQRKVEEATAERDEQQAAAAAEQAKLTVFSAVADRYLEEHAKSETKASSYNETKRILTVDVKPVWGGRPIASITRDDAKTLLGAVEKRGAPVQRNRTLARLKTLFNWCINEELIAASPVAGIKATKETARDRALDDDELRWFWTGCDQLAWPFGPLFQALLLTAQRRDEVGTLEWSELDLEKKLWVIPRAKAKNDRAHEVQLSDQTVTVLKGLFPAGGAAPTAGFVFTTLGDRPVSGFSKAKERLDLIMERLAREARGLPIEEDDYRKTLDLPEDAELPRQVPEWILHDLRRTATTGMAALNMPPHVVDKILNHVSGTIRGVAAVYNRHAYLPERRAALDGWGRYVDNLIRPTPSNVVTLPTSRGAVNG